MINRADAVLSQDSDAVADGVVIEEDWLDDVPYCRRLPTNSKNSRAKKHWHFKPADKTMYDFLIDPDIHPTVLPGAHGHCAPGRAYSHKLGEWTSTCMCH